MIRHKVINGICYLYETTQTYKGACTDPTHPHAKKPSDTKSDAQDAP